MARSPYLTRRDGRYYLQIRVGSKAAPLIGISVIRMALRTCEHRVARQRLMRCLPWVLDVVESKHFAGLIQRCALRLDEYAVADRRVDADVLFERRNFEELLKNLNRRIQAAGFDPVSADPDWLRLINDFVAQNVRIEKELNEERHHESYERGRRDEREAAASGFGSAAAPVQANGVDTLMMAIEHELERPGPLQARPAITRVPEFPVTTPVTETQTATIIDGTDEKRRLRMSEVLKLYLEADKKKTKKAAAVSDVAPTIQFMIDALGDPLLSTVLHEDCARIDAMLPDIPFPKGIPRKEAKGLYGRYMYAQKHGWDGLERLAENSVRNRYASGFSRFFTWAIDNGYMSGPRYVFKETSEKLYVEHPRDAFEDNEILTLVSQPLFTGCSGTSHVWTEGKYFLQNHFYWGYLILLLTGMRPGEVAQLKLHQFAEGDDFYQFDLRPFDPRLRRVTREEMPNLKTKNAERTIPIHPLLIDLGLKDRVDGLRELGCERLLPEWPIPIKPSGDETPGRAITRNWSNLSKKLGFDRADLTLYSTRHWMAQLLDDQKVANRTRKRMMGHAGANGDEVPLRYGSKGLMNKEQAGFIVELDTPLISKMRAILMLAKEKADRGELIRLKPWLTPANWAEVGVQKRRPS